MEMQRGICGDLAHIGSLRDAVEQRGIEASTAKLLHSARAASIPVAHCTFSLPGDRTGLDLSLPLLRAARKDPLYLLKDSAASELLGLLGPEETDIIIDRSHGVSPFAGTDLHATLDTLRVDSVVIAGVSLNVGVIGTAIEAVNLGYHVTVATDAVVGVPVGYGDDVLSNAIVAIARLASVDELCAEFDSPKP